MSIATRDTLALAPRGDREIVLTRQFAAPRDLVFDAYTKPELLVRWLGVRGGWTLAICEVDLRPGGTLHWVWRRTADGTEMGMRGTYLEVVRPSRIVHTERFDQAWYPGEAVITTTLEETGRRTLLTVVMCYESNAARDGVLASPMERGLREGYEMLDRILGPIEGA